MKLPIRPLGLVAAGLLIGTALAPVAAQQQQSGIDGQVAVRSDGAVFLITNGQRRWVATVVISDDELNAYPEGEPVYGGLAPLGSAQAAAPAAQPKPSASPQAASSAPQPTAKPSSSSSSSASSDPNRSADLPITVDIDGEPKFEPGDSFKVQVKTRANYVCELVAKMPDGSEVVEDSSTAPTDGKCRFTIEIPKTMKTGDGTLIGTVREGGRYNTMELPFSVVAPD